jgi:two-component system OmpR family sensor kinase
LNLGKWSLRSRLLLATLSLAAVGILISDFAAETALRSFLITQVDKQLTGIIDQSSQRLDRAGIENQPTVPTDDNALAYRPVRPLRGVPTSTRVSLLDLNGKVIGQIGGDISTVNQFPTFKGLDQKSVTALNGKPFTVHGLGGLPDIRAVAQLLPSGLGTVVVSTSLTDIENTSHELAILFFVITAIMLLVLAALARLIIAISLKPLREVETTAAAFADGDFTARLPQNNPKTEVGRLSKSLNSMLGRIEESFAAKVESESKLRRFVADASHELRTPLTAIRGFAELHRQGAVSGTEPTKELLGRIESESIRMGALVEDLLLLARMDQAPQLKQEPVDLNQVISECVASARAAGPNHPISVRLGDEDNYVLGDAIRVHQAIQNLLANARTHTPTGTAIEINVESDDRELRVSVSDHGPGLSAQDQEKIFERFFRADPSRVRKGGEGAGLGLAIVDAVMKAHHGKVSVTSELGKGATFTLHFPIEA